MIITCPYCGPRDLSEFTYQGDAARTRPDPASTDEAAWHAWVYERANPAGGHREFWQHSGGCRAHLLVHRHTRNHEIGEVAFARDVRNVAAGARRTPAATPKAPGSKSGVKAAARPPRPRAAGKGDAK